MAFDAGMLAAVTDEINRFGAGSRIEKIGQPGKDEVVFTLRPQRSTGTESLRLSVNFGAATPKLSFTYNEKENPATPPNFCILLRKHLSGAKLERAEMPSFERAVHIYFSARDDMGFPCGKVLIAEIMGKYSNLMLTDEGGRILAPGRPVDLMMSSKRTVLPGMQYEAPPAQDKRDPLSETRGGFDEFMKSRQDIHAERALLDGYAGISPLTAREIAYTAGALGKAVGETDAVALSDAFFGFTDTVRNRRFVPVLVLEDQKPLEFSFFPVRQYGEKAETVVCRDFGELCDRYFGERERASSVRQKGNDILHLLSSAKAKIQKKLEIMAQEKHEAENAGEYRHIGDLITANIYRIEKGAEGVSVTDYGADGCPEVILRLDKRLSAAANAQKYYKKYNKAKSALERIDEQTGIAESELSYLESVEDALSRADGESELSEIRDELRECGYGARLGKSRMPGRRRSEPLEYRTSGGYRVLCGRNNIQNDILTHKTAAKGDLFFHVKGMPGSHVILFCDGGEPPAQDYTEAAMIAAVHSCADMRGQIPVDYTRVKNVKKPAGGRPGLVIYHTNYSAYVDYDRETVEKLRVK